MEHVKNAMPMHSTIIKKKGGKPTEKMKEFVGIWMEHRRRRRATLSLMMIQEKAKSLLNDLKVKAGENVADEVLSASYGWSHRLKKRANLHHVSVRSEATSADKPAAEQFPKTLKEITDKESYTPQQIFNIKEAGLIKKKKCQKKRTSAVKRRQCQDLSRRH